MTPCPICRTPMPSDRKVCSRRCAYQNFKRVHNDNLTSRSSRRRKLESDLDTTSGRGWRR